MAKLSEDDQKELDRLTALANAPDADDDEVWVENPQGQRTKLTGARAKAWLKRNGYDEDEGDQAAADADAREARKSGGKGGAPAKKAAPVKKTSSAPRGGNADDAEVEDTGEEDEGGELEQDAPAPAGRRRAFF